MLKHTRYFGLIGLVTLPVCCGCALTLDSIPTGVWEGPGEWSGLREDQGRTIPVSGRYTTTVTIEKRTIEDRRILVFEILSKHPEDSQLELGDVHVLLALDKPRKPDDAGLEFDAFANVQTSKGWGGQEPFSNDVADLLANHAIPVARLNRSGDEITLQVNYEKPDQAMRLPFTESFTFTGRLLIKKGQIISADTGQPQMQWRENLRKGP